MNISKTTPSFQGNYAVMIKKTETAKINSFMKMAEDFVEIHRKNSMNRVKADIIDLPNNPQSKMFVFSMPNFINHAFFDMVEKAKLKHVDLDRLG